MLKIDNKPKMFKKNFHQVKRKLYLAYIKIFKMQGPHHLVYHASNKLNLGLINNFIIYNVWKFPKHPEISDMKLIEIDPRKVDYYYLFSFPVKGKNAVIGEGKGSWDKQKVPLDTCILYRSIKQRFLREKDWKETEIYENSRERIKNGLGGWNTGTVRSMDKIEQKCDKLDRLFQDILNNGYKPQKYLFEHSQDPDVRRHTIGVRDFRIPKEIGIALDRKGRLIQTADGRRRLSLLKVLSKITDSRMKIPAVLYLYHTNVSEKAGGKPLKLEHPLVERTN